LGTAYLHIGYPKTGTSSIQVFLRDNAQALLRLGYHVPQIGQGRVGAHHALVRTLSGLPVPPQQAVAEAEIVRELAGVGDRAILISSEMLTNFLSDPQVAPVLLGKLRAMGLRPVYIVYVRNQSQWLNSAYSQGVKSFRSMIGFDQYVAQVMAAGEGYNYNRWIGLAQQHDAELRVRPFSKEIRDTGVVADFLRAIDVDPSQPFAESPRTNESAGPFAVEAARRLLDWIPGGVEGLTFLQSTRCKLALDREIQTVGFSDGSYCGLDTAGAVRVEAHFADRNDRFAAAVWGSDWKTVFAKDIDQEFVPNDYRATGVPAEKEQPLEALVEKLKGEVTAILQNPRLNVQADWNARRV
jgi:hypothetical protein